jgi:hypothetical protein
MGKYIAIIVMAFTTASCAHAEGAKPKAVAQVQPQVQQSPDCSKLAQASDVHETVVFECKRGQVRCTIVKSGTTKGKTDKDTPAVAISCVKE